MPENVTRLAAHLRAQVGRAVVGQAEATDQILLTLLCGGHAVLEGVPGVAKTLAVKSTALACGIRFHRVQCTPDLMPADVVGTSVVNLATGEFTLRKGPVFTEILLVDEINRTPPRTQSALLEAMEERQVTIDGSRHALPWLFTVFATQNPIEFEGTYPLPEAQLDRFLMKIRFGYPDDEQETEILARHHGGFDAREIDRLGLAPIEAGLLEAARAETAGVGAEPALLRYAGAIARRSRDWPSLALGASPRASVGLLRVAKGIAALEGRDYLIPDDLKSAAPPVLRHRLLLRPEAEMEGLTSDDVVAEILAAVPVPR